MDTTVGYQHSGITVKVFIACLPYRYSSSFCLESRHPLRAVPVERHPSAVA